MFFEESFSLIKEPENKTKVIVVVILIHIPDDFTRSSIHFPQNDFHFSANNFLSIFLYVSHYLEIKFSSSMAFVWGLSACQKMKMFILPSERKFISYGWGGRWWGGKLHLFEGYLSEFLRPFNEVIFAKNSKGLESEGKMRGTFTSWAYRMELRRRRCHKEWNFHVTF